MAWLAERRAAVVAVYEAEAPAYDEHYYPSDVQQPADQPAGCRGEPGEPFIRHECLLHAVPAA
jgi:hypothetical protein